MTVFCQGRIYEIPEKYDPVTGLYGLTEGTNIYRMPAGMVKRFKLFLVHQYNHELPALRSWLRSLSLYDRQQIIITPILDTTD